MWLEALYDVGLVVGGVYLFIGSFIVISPFVFKNIGGVETVAVEKGTNVFLYNAKIVLKIVFLWPRMFKPVRDADGRIIGFHGDPDFMDEKEK